MIVGGTTGVIDWDGGLRAPPKPPGSSGPVKLGHSSGFETLFGSSPAGFRGILTSSMPKWLDGSTFPVKPGGGGRT